MADVVDRATRSRMMSGIKGKNTNPEMRVRRFLHRLGLRFRLHDPSLPGKPDLVFPKYRTVVEVHGCFWHQHPGCRYAYTPASNREFWSRKLASNVKRDSRNKRALKAAGWRVIILWECEVAKEQRLLKVARQIASRA